MGSKQREYLSYAGRQGVKCCHAEDPTKHIDAAWTNGVYTSRLQEHSSPRHYREAELTLGTGEVAGYVEAAGPLRGDGRH